MSPTPLFLSPALPSELLSYILNQHAHPSTLIICSSQRDFVSSAINHHFPSASALLSSSPLHQVATSRHIRVVYAPSVTHLRACLAAFSPGASRVPAPPSSTSATPALLVYGLLALHRDTSEWSAQGLGNTASALVELAHRLTWQAVLVEPLVVGEGEGQGDNVASPAVSGAQRRDARLSLADLLAETAPILSGGVRRKMGQGAGEAAWAGRTVEVGRVLGRWFVFQHGLWDEEEEGGRGG
ncbi:hypothetical protein F4775DRAFT_516561 [Biscogniauxia sp. FL1348]|nr:hypothetical protein F4775DRAFT_516561 [Biscogniauxia sp. FL1348]